MLTFATDSVRAFHPNAVIGDANGGLLDELAFENLGFDPIKRRTSFVPVTELPAREVSEVESEDEAEFVDEPTFTDRYAAMADNLGLSAHEWEEIEDEFDLNRDLDQESYYSRPWEIEACHDEIVEAFDAELCRARRKALKAKNGHKDIFHWPNGKVDTCVDCNPPGRARRGKGDGRRSRRAVPTHDVFALPTPTLKELDAAIAHDEFEVEIECYEDDYKFDLDLYLTDPERWFYTRLTSRGRALLTWMCQEQSRHDDYSLYAQSCEVAEYLRWTRKVNMAYSPEATIEFDSWLHAHAACSYACLVCKHQMAQAEREHEEGVYWQSYDLHDDGQCDSRTCTHCADNRLRAEAERLWRAHESGTCRTSCRHCADEMDAHEHRELTLDELQERFERALIAERLRERHESSDRRGRERLYRGRQWQRHKPRHKPTVPAWVQFEPVIYEDDILVAA